MRLDEKRGRSRSRARLHTDRSGTGSSAYRGSTRSPSSVPIAGPPRPVLIACDGRVEGLPWEGVPGLWGGRAGGYLHRAPSLALMLTLAADADVDDSDRGLGRKISTTTPTPCLDPRRAVAVVNPTGDLDRTEATFRDWIESLRGWRTYWGRAGRPAPHQLLAHLRDSHLYVYMGHGAGEGLLGPATLRRLRDTGQADERSAEAIARETGVITRRNAPLLPTALLVGCSSARLRGGGTYDVTGPALSYLAAGLPSVLGMLWDVTDGDVDKLAQGIIRRWLAGVGVGMGRAVHHTHRPQQQQQVEVESVRGLGGLSLVVTAAITPVAAPTTSGRRRPGGRLQAMGLMTPAPAAPAPVATPRQGRTTTGTATKAAVVTSGAAAGGGGGPGRRGRWPVAVALQFADGSEAGDEHGDEDMDRSRTRRREGETEDVGGIGGLGDAVGRWAMEVVEEARSDPRLRHLTGMAPVYYGLPLRVRRHEEVE